MTTRAVVVTVWIAIGVGLLVCLSTVLLARGRLPGPGAAARAVTGGRVRLVVVMLGWMWLGWHAFAR